MPQKTIAVTTPEWIERFQRSTIAVEREFGTTFRRRRPPLVTGGGGGCDAQNTIWQITIIGKPTGGTLALQVTVNGVSTSITFNWNDSAATFKSTLAAGHSEIATTDLTITGGGFPNSTMEVEFIGALALTDIRLPYATWSSLTGGSGVAIIPSLAQKGHAA